MNDRQTRAAVAAIVGLAAALRLLHANAEFWFDEIVTVIFFVRRPFSEVVGTYALANNHVLNSALVHLTASRLGEAPWSVRLPAITFGVAGVWAFWFTARVLWRREAALLGTLLFAVSYHHIYYSQNARGYSALIFFALTATGCAVRLVENPTSAPGRRLVGYAAAVAFGLYAMLLMAFVVAGHATVFLVRRQWRMLIVLGCGVCAAAVLYAPMASSMIEYYRTSPVETGYPLLSRAFVRMFGATALLLTAAGIVALPVLMRLARRRPLAAALLLSPIAFNVIIPVLRGQGVYPRSFVFGLAVAYLLLVEALDWAFDRRPIVGLAMGAAIVVASIVALVPFYRLPKQGFREALAYIDQHRSAGDDRIGFTLGGKAARFYDPSFVLIEDAGQLHAWMSGARRPGWIVSTFASEMKADSPELYQWLQTEASRQAEFPGVIGDGTVHVHYWTPTGKR